MAVDRNPDVMEMVEKELRDDPDISNTDLKLKAEEIDEGIADLSARQFNARYPLQVKRRMSADQKAEEAEEQTGESTVQETDTDEFRAELRDALIEFARDVAGAEDRGKVIDVLTSVDEYVDRVMEKA